MPNSRQFCRSVSICCLAIGSAIGSGDRSSARCGRRGHGPLGPPHLAPGQPQSFEGLGAGHFVDQVQVDVQDRLLAVFGLDDVGVPDFLEHRAGSGIRHGNIGRGFLWSLPEKNDSKSAAAVRPARMLNYRSPPPRAGVVPGGHVLGAVSFWGQRPLMLKPGATPLVSIGA